MGILKGKVAIVTGSGKGLGRAEAISLAKEGASVVICARTETDIHRVAEEIRMFGGEVLPVVCDVSIREQVDNTVEQALSAFGGIDILVNNAQYIPCSTPLEDWTEQMHRDCWESGYLGSCFFMSACFPYSKKKDARIINTCSCAGYGYGAGYGGYGAAKEAIRALTRTAAQEWGPYDIKANAIAPCGRTDGAIKSVPKMDEETEQAIISSMPLRRWPREEEDIGRVVVFLAGPDASYLTGSTLSIDGGGTMIV
jgi:NAD(P)-dependent dehydrogenase (short-subunit alcohol dehydrogenase family)